MIISKSSCHYQIVCDDNYVNSHSVEYYFCELYLLLNIHKYFGATHIDIMVQRISKSESS